MQLQLLANAGELLSVETIAGCMAHPLISALSGSSATVESAVTDLPDLVDGAGVDSSDGTIRPRPTGRQ